MFKFRRQLGLDFALEALKAYRERDAFDVGELLHYVHICRVRTVMKACLEAIV